MTEISLEPDTNQNPAPAAPRKAPRKFKFTVKEIDALLPPTAGRAYYYDTEIRGLCICITSTGAKSYYLYRKVKNRPERIRLGDAEDITIQQARDSAAEKVGLIHRGINPQREKVMAREGTTFGELFQAYLKLYKTPRRPKSAPQDDDNYRLHLKQWENRLAVEITDVEVSALHASKGKEHPTLANRLIALISTMYNQAKAVGIILKDPKTGHPHPNPAAGINKFPEKKREKYLNPDAMPLLFQNLANLKNQTTADFFRICLFTGQRRDNVQCMQWADIDLERGVWTIPDTKANRAHTVPLTGEALKILKTRKKAGVASPWVFTSDRSETGHLVEPKKAWKSLMEKSELTGYRIHDLRHTLASWMAADGTSLAIIGKGLGHSQTATTQRYAHIDTDPVREAMAATTAAIMKAGKKKPPKEREAA